LIFVENPVDWSVDDVYYWAIGKVGVDEESASILKNRNVDGKALWNLNKIEILNKSPYDMPAQSASLLVRAIRQILPIIVPGILSIAYKRQVPIAKI
jgi:hypothetical protein